MITVIEAGCAECGVSPGEPLIERREFESVEAAKAWADSMPWIKGRRDTVNWMPHPQGGEHVVVGQGSVWILPSD